MNKTKTLAILTLFLVVGLIGLSSAGIVTFNPSSGKDTTNETTYTLSASDLSLVSQSDDNRYESQGIWNHWTFTPSEYIEWKFSPDMNENALVNDVALHFEWQRGAFVSPVARFHIWDESARRWVTETLVNLPSNDDYTETLSLNHFINTPEDLNDLKIKFYAFDDPQVTRHDWIELEVDYSLDEEAPECSIDYLQHKVSHNTFSFSNSIYINEVGRFYTYGYAWDDQSIIDNVQENRTGPNGFYYRFADAHPTDGSFNEQEENWRTAPNNPDNFEEGWHTACCRAVDIHNNGEDGDGYCQTFCIDVSAPESVESIVHSNPGECNPHYVNYAPEFSWDEASDNGCAGIDYYEIEAYDSEGLLYVTQTESNEHTIPFPVSGEHYYIRVRAIDRAGNEGSWSGFSNHVYYDTDNPTVTLTSPKEGSWFNTDFTVYETDEDNLGLFACAYKIENNEVTTLDWTNTPCGENQPISIDISEVCPQDTSCVVHKRVKDLACNMDHDMRGFNLDREAPTTEKMVGEPKFPGFLWNNVLVDWFIKSDTLITLNCEDGQGIGQDTIYYQINNGSWMPYAEPFILGEEDGLYFLHYYCEDLLGNIEETNHEIDKVDTLPPTSSLTYNGTIFWKTQGIGEINAFIKFIGLDTSLLLSSEDSEVGLNTTYWGILTPCTGEDSCSHQEYYGNQTYEWFLSEGDCLENNTVCLPSLWESKMIEYESVMPYMQYACGNEAIYVENLDLWFCPYNGPLTFEDTSDEKICYYSVDHLENTEDLSCDVYSVDTEKPEIIVHNPSESEQYDLRRCDQSVVVEVIDTEVGVNPASVYAELYDSEETLVRGPISLNQAIYPGNNGGIIFEGLIDTQLPAGNYMLKVYAKDYVGNEQIVAVEEILKAGVYVEYLDPATCNIDIELGGRCALGFNVCMRDSSSIKMWMNKLGSNPGLITPDMVNATIWAHNASTYVGLLNSSGAGLLMLGNETLHQKSSFLLTLDFSPNITSLIGGSHALDYYLEAYDEHEEY